MHRVNTFPKREPRKKKVKSKSKHFSEKLVSRDVEESRACIMHHRTNQAYPSLSRNGLRINDGTRRNASGRAVGRKVIGLEGRATFARTHIHTSECILRIHTYLGREGGGIY